jgi:prevent-host-death family protein
MASWQLQEAKARLSELVKSAEQDGPQEITVHGRAAAVVVSAHDYGRLCGAAGSLVDFMRRSPFYGLDEPEFPRDQSPARKVAFLSYLLDTNVLSELRRKQPDAQVVLQHGLIMVTRNVRDSAFQGLDVIDPWLPQPEA